MPNGSLIQDMNKAFGKFTQEEKIITIRRS